MNTYTVIVKFAVTDDSDDHLQNEQAIQEEFESWLQGLRAVVESVTVEKGASR